MRALHALLQPYDRLGAPGCVLGVVSGGELVFASAIGTADLERGVPISTGSVFDIGSTGKQFTAACVTLLELDGVIRFADDVRDVLPALHRLPARVTVGDLVHHTSGIRDYLALTHLAGRSLDNDYDEDEVVALLARQRSLEFPPGTAFSYSNSGYFLLAELVRQVSGRSLRTFAHERLLEPLGMHHSFFHDDRTEIVRDRALAYSPVADGAYRINVSQWDVLGDGALFTTLADLVRWDAQFYDCTLPGGAELVDRLQRRGRLADGTPLDYARGLMLGTHRGFNTVHHGGSWGGYRTQFIRMPQRRLSVIVLTNTPEIVPTDVATAALDVMLDDAGDAPRGGSPAPAAAGADADATPRRPLPVAWAGRYADATWTTLAEVTLDGDDARVSVLGVTRPLLPAADGTATIEGLPGSLARQGDLLELRLPSATTELRRVAGEADTGIDESTLVGTYHSAELDASFRIAAAGSGLRLRRGWSPWVDLEPFAPGVYRAGTIVLRVVDPAAGAAGGLRLGTRSVAAIDLTPVADEELTAAPA